MKTFAFALLGALATATDLETKFMEWIAEHGRSYGTMEEYTFRQARWAELEAFIEEHNAKESTYTLGHNRMSDWTSAEYKRLLGYKASPIPAENPPAPASMVASPSSVDWVQAGAVTPVKDQAQCGSCWAFSSTGAMEGSNKIFGSGNLTSQSEQQLVSCVQLCYGCNGGNTGIVFGYYAQNNNMYTESGWPYTSGHGDSGTCTYPSTSGEVSPVYRSKGSVAVTQENESALKTAIAAQPISVAIEADQTAFQSYKSGVFSATCGTQLDHAVLLTGYETSGTPYYHMKNSWGTSWGESGYMKMAMTGNGTGTCGVQMQPNHPAH